MKLIAGLGNPGTEYAANRHNIGFMCLSYIAKANRIVFDKKQGKARIGLGRIAGEDVILARPQTYMNLSGQAVRPLMQKYNLTLDDLYVIHDDLDLPLGKIRIKRGNSAAGHNGVKSIIAELGSQDFVRIRVGIGRPQAADEGRNNEVVDFVLGDFAREDKSILDGLLPRVSEAISCLLTDGLVVAMNRFN